jgi:hypothetical protein
VELEDGGAMMGKRAYNSPERAKYLQLHILTSCAQFKNNIICQSLTEATI